jgi:LmbE family N-acetylglucosaminyl deacetylase
MTTAESVAARHTPVQSSQTAAAYDVLLDLDPAMLRHALPESASVLAVCAHPDDESFGLGAVLSAFVDTRTLVSLLCFTRGEASTLSGTADDLAETRAHELAAAAVVLGIARTQLLDYPDGSLTAQPLDALASDVRRLAREATADT